MFFLYHLSLQLCDSHLGPWSILSLLFFCVNVVSSASRFTFQMLMSSCSSTICWNTIFALCTAFAPLSVISWLYLLGLFLGSFLCCIHPCVCSFTNNTVLITVAVIFEVKLVSILQPCSFPSIFCWLFWVFCFFIWTLKSVCWYPQNNLLRRWKKGKYERLKYFTYFRKQKTIKLKMNAYAEWGLK